MEIQKHSIYQISVPFKIIATEDEIIFSRYLMVNCFTIETINYIRIEVEEIYDIKENPLDQRKIKVIKDFQFHERELNGSLHIILNALCKSEVTGNTEIVFALSLFNEILLLIINELEDYFPDWDIIQFINEAKVPGTMSKLLKFKKE